MPPTATTAPPPRWTMGAALVEGACRWREPEGDGNDVVVAAMSSGARRCGNDVVGRVAGGGSTGARGAGRAGVPAEVLTLILKETHPWTIGPVITAPMEHRAG